MIEREIPCLGLRRVRKCLSVLEHPEKKLKFIHILGTNGKGSTAIFFEAALRGMGYSVGTYTSPHLIEERERVRINGEKISPGNYLKARKRIEYLMKKESLQLSYFEKRTMMALLIFKEFEPDWIVWEAGLGGRLDAPSAVKPELTVFTSIGMDHMEYLGNTIEKIVREKASAMKKAVPAVTANRGIALSLLRKEARRKVLPFFAVGDEIKIRKEKKRWTLYFGEEDRSFSFAGLGLEGDFQTENASLALSGLLILERSGKIGRMPQNILKSWEKVSWPGRFQRFIVRGKKVIVDGGHNPSAGKAFSRNVSGRNNLLILAMSREKDVRGYFKAVEDKFAIIIFSQSSSWRSLKAEELYRRSGLRKGKKYMIIPDLKRAVTAALKTPSKRIYIAGSLFAAGDALRFLRREYGCRI